ncbi:MAG TPA: VOC family protein [Candidatus Paceibacterota bacterium]
MHLNHPIVPHLWFDTEAVEATAFYTSLFPQSKIIAVNQIKDTPSGDCDIVSFELLGQECMAISAGPYFKFTPAISLMVNFDAAQDSEAATRIDEVWEKMSEGGTALMPLGEYPFSKRYGWIQDKYGLSWQLILTDPEGEVRPPLIPMLLYISESGEKAEAATDYYLSVFSGSARGTMARYPAGMEPNKEGAVMFTDFRIGDQWFAAMDGLASQHTYNFNESVSLMVKCDTQEEIDYFWERLSAEPEAEQCGWCKDKFGVSWQIVPKAMDAMMGSGDSAAAQRVTQAFLQMKKFDIATLERAYNGEV